MKSCEYTANKFLRIYCLFQNLKMDPIWVSGDNITSIKLGTKEDNMEKLDSLGLIGRTEWEHPKIFGSALLDTALLAFVGNVTVIFVLSYGKRCPMSLRKFLINLSLADVSIALFSIPFTYTDFMLGYWIFPNFHVSPSLSSFRFCPFS